MLNFLVHVRLLKVEDLFLVHQSFKNVSLCMSVCASVCACARQENQKHNFNFAWLYPVSKNYLIEICYAIQYMIKTFHNFN